MQWDWHSRSLKLSVGELSRFSLIAPTEEGAGRWRMELGSHWHQVLQERTLSTEPGWLFEQAVSGSLSQNGWMFDLRGRIDQFKPGKDPILREIKTTSRVLPADENVLRETYPHYFHQAMLYAFLLGKEGEFPSTELVFLEIQTGMTQTVVLGESDLSALYHHLNKVVSTLEERHNHFGRLRSYKVPPPFTEWRPGQEAARDSLALAMQTSAKALFEAPTGFGKTGLALELGLNRLAAGDVDRILLLTGKNTGHAPLLKQLQIFQDEGHRLAVHALRSRKDLALEPESEARLSAVHIADSWEASRLSAPALLAEGFLELDDLKALGEQHGIPPWVISRILLPHADVWIADFNYLFDPAVSQVLSSIPTYDPSRTFLIVDEAHNLPDRVAASHSHLLDARQIEQMLSEVQFARYSGKLARLLDVLLTMVKRQSPCDSLDPPTEADLMGLLREIKDCLYESAFMDDELSPESVDWLWNLSYLLQDWDHPHLPILANCPKAGRIQLSCIDASALIGPELDRFFQCILMSATLQPWDAFIAETGIDKTKGEVARIRGDAPWLEGCFEVIVDARVDTRYRHRETHIGTTATTIGETALADKGCTVVFFPSYRYAEMVMERLRFTHPGLRCVIQPKDLPLEKQHGFLEEALLVQDVLMLVLGSRFSEGIDTLGGRIRTAIVVSPALPEVNSIQRARESRAPGGSAGAFRSVYLIPGLRKVSQALGRLVRSPRQSARVLLHGKRFMEPVYQDLLPVYLQPIDSIITDEEFDKKWLNPPRGR